MIVRADKKIFYRAIFFARILLTTQILCGIINPIFEISKIKTCIFGIAVYFFTGKVHKL